MMLTVLTEREFPVGELRPLASQAGGRSVSFAGRQWPVREATPDAFEGVDIALFSAGGGPSKALAPEAAKRGVLVIDNSSTWRQDPGVPLVVVDVNSEDAAGHEGIIANPNCSTMQLVPLLKALRDAVGLERVIVDTYQSVSGTGGKAVKELEGQIQAYAAGQPMEHSVYPHQIAFNALPEIDVFRDDGYTKEEWKMLVESRKILHLPELPLSATCVRVPVIAAHSLAVHAETDASGRPADRARALCAGARRDRGGRPRHPPVPVGHGCRRPRRGLRRTDPPGHVAARRPRTGLLGGLRQPPQGRCHQRGPDCRARPAPRLAGAGIPAARASLVTLTGTSATTCVAA